jgi:hypothetical protein
MTPQLPVRTKSEALVPLIVIEVTVSEPEPDGAHAEIIPFTQLLMPIGIAIEEVSYPCLPNVRTGEA